MTIKLHSSFAVHPGECLRAEIVKPAGLSVTALAERLHVARQAARNLLNGNMGLSREIAIRFEKGFGVKADTLMRMQAAHELAQTPAREDEIVWTRLKTSHWIALPVLQLRVPAVPRPRGTYHHDEAWHGSSGTRV